MTYFGYFHTKGPTTAIFEVISKSNSFTLPAKYKMTGRLLDHTKSFASH